MSCFYLRFFPHVVLYWNMYALQYTIYNCVAFCVIAEFASRWIGGTERKNAEQCTRKQRA